MANFEKLRKWVINSEFSSVYDAWVENGGKKIVDRTNEYSEDTLYRLELKETNSALNGCLLYCAKNHKGKVNWSTFSRVGNKACEVYTNGRDSKSGIFYCLLTKEQFNDINTGEITSGNPLIKKVVLDLEEADTIADLMLGDAVVISASNEEGLGGNVYVKMGEGEWEFVCSIHDKKTFVISKVYTSVGEMESDINNFDDVDYYDFVLAKAENNDYELYQKFIIVKNGVTQPYFQLMGRMKDAFFIEEFNNLKSEIEELVAPVEEKLERMEELTDEAEEHREASEEARQHIEEIANLVDELHDEVLEDNEELRNEFTDSLKETLINEIKGNLKEEILDELSDTQSISVMIPSVGEGGIIGWELKHYTSEEEAREDLASLQSDEGLMDIIEDIQEQIDSKFGDARVTDDYELYFYANASDSDSEDVCGPITGIGGAGGGGTGGGTGGNNAVLTVSNRTGWATATIADGSKCTISFVWSSIEEGFSTGPGALSIKVGGVTYVASAPIQNGATITRDISSYLTAGTKNKVVVEVSDCYGNKKTLRFTVQVVALKITSTFDPYVTYSNEFDLRVTPTGDASKVMHYVIDGDYETIVAKTQNLNNAYKQVGKKPKAEEGVTYYTFDESTNAYVEYPTVEVGETVMGGYYVQDPITYTQCGEEEVAELGVQYYELIDGGYIALERVIIGSPVNEYFTQDEITYTLLVEEDSVAEEDVQYYELITNTVGETTSTYYVKKEVVVGETVVNDYYTCLYEYGGTELNHYTVNLSDGRGTITQDGLLTTSNGTPLTQKIGEQTHGAHTVDIWFESVIEGASASSNILHYEFAYLAEGHSEPILITQFVGNEIEQYETIKIEFKVITPNSEETALVNVYVNDLVEEGSEEYTDAKLTLRNVSQEKQLFTYRADNIVEKGTDSEGNPITENGWVKIRFAVGEDELTRDFHIVVTPCTIVVKPVAENLDFYLTSNCGKTNGASGYTDWSYNGIGAQFSNFTWTSDGWQTDSQGYPVMRLLANARIFIPFYPFVRDFGTSGETIEIEFSTSNIYNYDTPIISCWDEAQQRGFKVTSQRFIFKTQLTQLSTQFKEDEHVRVSFSISENRGDRIITCYLNGIMSGAVQYDRNNDFSQSTPQGISIGCNDATVDIYNIRFYNRGLSRDEIVTNWVADTFDGLTRKIRYEHNDIFDNGYITPDTLPEDLPYMIISPVDGVSTFEEGMPNAKGDTHQIHGEYHDIQHPEYSFEYNALIDVQGSSSQFYPRKNYEIKLKKATTPYVKYLEKSEAESKPRYKLRDNSVATSTFTFKADYASSEGANNVELTKLYNDLQKNVIWKTPRQQDAYDKGDSTDYRIGIDGYPMAVFYRVGNDTKFIGKYNFNNSKGTPEVYGFDYYEDENNPTGYPIESWETLNNVSNRVIWKDDNFDGTDWANDFEARYMDEVPSYKRTTDTSVVEGKQYFYQDPSTKLYVKYGYVWSNAQMKFIPSGSLVPSASELHNLYEPIMDGDEQAVEVNTNVTAISTLATWLKSVDTGYILNSAMKPTTTPSYAVSMDFREKEVADGANVCGLYVYDGDKMVKVGKVEPVMDDPTALYAEYNESTGTFNPVDVELGEVVTGLYLISDGGYNLQSESDSIAIATKYYELVEDEYVEVEDIEVGVTVVNDYYIGYVGTHENKLITNASAIKEDGVTYYEAYNFHGVTFDEPITLTYNTYQYDSANTGDYNKIPKTETFEEDNTEYRQAKFKVEFEEHFHKSTTLFYYLFTEMFLMVDSRAKNAFATTWDGQHWSWVPYDMDTAIGINNEGALEFGYDLEDYMYVGANGEGIVVPTANSANVYNGAESVLWRNIRDCFYEELAMLYKDLRKSTTVGTGADAKIFTLSYDEVERRFEEHQSKWPEKLVNEDSYFKYIEPLLYNSEDYLEMLQGLKAEQRKWWLYNRFRYMDAKYFAGDAKSNTITFRSYNAGTFTITPYADIYARVRNGNYIVSARAPRNVATSLHAGTEINNDLETAIYSADQLKSVGDLSLFAPGWCNISMATKLQELKVGGAIDNSNFTQLTLGNNTLLRKIIATHLPSLVTPIDATGCTSLEEVYFEASGITAINLPNGGILKTLHLPDTITRLELLNQTYLTDFEVSSVSNNSNVYRNISDLIINNASSVVYEQLDEIISQMADNSRVRLLNTPLHFEGETTEECWNNFETFINSLSNLRGIDSNGDTTDKAVVTGDVLLDNVEYNNFNNTVDLDNTYIIETDDGAVAVAYRGKESEGLNDFRFKYANCEDTTVWNYNNNGEIASETHNPVHTWVGEEENWAKTPISAITPTTDAPNTAVPTRTSTSNHVEEGDIVDYAFEFVGWTREEVAEDNVNGKNTYIVRGEEDVIEVETGDSFPVVKDETFTATYKAHPIYYVNFYDRAQRSTGAETGVSDARLGIELVRESESIPSEVFAGEGLGRNITTITGDTVYISPAIYGNNPSAFTKSFVLEHFDTDDDGVKCVWCMDSTDTVALPCYVVESGKFLYCKPITIGGTTYRVSSSGVGRTLYFDRDCTIPVSVPAVYTYEKSYVDGTYTEERLGEVPSITVPLTDPLDWRTNFNDNTIGQDEFERVQDYQYYFKGWTRNANTTIYNYGEDTPEDFFADGEELTVEGNTNFYAVYEKHAIYYADFYDVVGDTGNKLLYTTCMIDGVDGESIGAYGGVTALTKAYNDHNHEHGDSVFGYTYYFDGFKEGKEKFIYDLHEGRIIGEAEGTRTATLDIDGTVGVIHENKKFYTVYEARQTYYIAFFNDGVFMHEDKNVLGFESYTYTGSGTRTSVDNSHVRGDAQFGYNFYHRGWNDHNSDLTYDLTLTEDTTVDGRPVKSTACNEFTTTFSNLDGNRNFYEVYEAKQVYYLNFKSWNGEAYLGDEKSFEIGSLGNDSGIPTTRVDYGTHVVDDDNSTYKFEFGGWSLTVVDSEDELTNNHTVAYPTTVTGYDYAEGATNIILNGNTFLYGMYQSRKAYYVSFHDHEGNLLSANNESILWEGTTITWNGDASALARATTNNHATDSSAVDYQYEFVGWSAEEVSYDPLTLKRGDYYSSGGKKYFKLPDTVYAEIDGVYEEYTLSVGDSFNTWNGQSMSWNSGTIVEGNYGDRGQGKYAQMSSTYAMDITMSVTIDEHRINLYVLNITLTTELNPTYSNSSVTYSAPTYYMHNAIGQGATSNIKVYATYQKRPIYYVNFYDWNDEEVATPISGGMTVNWGKCGGTEDVIVTYGEDDPLYVPKAFLGEAFTTLGNTSGYVPEREGTFDKEIGYQGTLRYRYENGSVAFGYICVYKLDYEFGKWLYENSESATTTSTAYSLMPDHGIAIYSDTLTDSSAWVRSDTFGIGIKTKEDIDAMYPNHPTAVGMRYVTLDKTNLEDDTYYLVAQTTLEINNSTIYGHLNLFGDNTIYFRHWVDLSSAPTSNTSKQGRKYTLSEDPVISVHSTPYLEGGNTSTTSFDLTSASASGNCVYTRTEVPKTDVSLTRARTNHHEDDYTLSDMSYEFYGWKTSKFNTGDMTNAWDESDTVPSGVIAKANTLGFLSANTDFYACYTKSNIYYVDFFNTMSSDEAPKTMEVNWGKCGTRDTDLIKTYTEGQPIELPVEFLRYTFGTTRVGNSIPEAISAEPNTNDVGFQRVFTSSGRGDDTWAQVLVYKLPQNLGEFLYRVAENHPYGEADYHSGSGYSYGGYEAENYNYKGLAIYPSDVTVNNSSGQWGVGIRKKSDLWAFGYKNSTDFSFENLDTKLKATWEALPEYQALEDDAYYMVVETDNQSGNSAHFLFAWINKFWKNCSEPIYFRTTYGLAYTPFTTSMYNTNFNSATCADPILLSFAPVAFHSQEITNGQAITFNGTVPSDFTESNHATDSSKCDYNYEFVGWNEPVIPQNVWIPTSSDFKYQSAVAKYGFMLPPNATNVPSDGSLWVYDASGNLDSNWSLKTSNGVRYVYGPRSSFNGVSSTYGFMKSGTGNPSTSYSIKVPGEPQVTTELNPTYSGSSVTYSAPNYYMYNSIGANTTSNIQVYATYQKRPVYYVDFYDWDNEKIENPVIVNWGRCGTSEDVITTFEDGDKLYIPEEFLFATTTTVGKDEVGYLGRGNSVNSGSVKLHYYRLPQEYGKYLYDNSESKISGNCYNQSYWVGWKGLFKAMALYPDLTSWRSSSGYPASEYSASWGVGFRKGSELGMRSYGTMATDTVPQEILDKVNSDDYYMVWECTPPTSSIEWNNVYSYTGEPYLRKWADMTSVPTEGAVGEVFTMDVSTYPFEEPKYLEGGATSTTTFDATSASASGSCTYTRTDIPMVNVSLTRANTEHHSLSDTSANDYNYSYYGWKTSITGTGDNANAYRSESMPSEVKAKTGTLGFVGANTSFYAVYEQKNIYYVDFYNTASPNYQSITVDWGVGQGGVVTYNAGEGLWIPTEFLKTGYTTVGGTSTPTEDNLDSSIGYKTWFGIDDHDKTERQELGSFFICVYKLPQEFGKYLYENAESNLGVHDDYNTTLGTGLSEGYNAYLRNYKGIAIYPDNPSTWQESDGWGVGIRKKEDLCVLGHFANGEQVKCTSANNWDYSCIENYTQYKALEDDAYYLVAQCRKSSYGYGTLPDQLKMFDIDDTGTDHVYLRHYNTMTAPPHWTDWVKTTDDPTNIGEKYVYAVDAPFCAKGYVEGTSASTLASTTNVVRTLGTTTEPTKASEDLWYYEYRGWSTESNDCIVNASSSDEILSVIEKWTTDNIGVMNSNTDLYAVFEKQPKVFVDIYNEGTKLGRLNGFKHVGYNYSSAYVIANEFNPSKADSLNHVVGNYGTDVTYTFKGYVTEQATGDEWTSSMTLIGSSGTINVGATENTLSAPYNDGYDPTTHVLTLHAVYETSKTFYLDFYEAKVTNGTPVYPTSATIDDFNYRGSVSFNENKTILSGETPVLNAPSSDMYADYTLGSNYSTDSVSNVTLEQIMDRCLPFQGSVDVDLTPSVTPYGWTSTDVVAPEGYDIYMSDNYNLSSSFAVCKLTFHDCTECDIYIRSYAEGNYDFTIASQVNASSCPTSESGAKAHTKGNQKSGTTLADYTKVSYTGLNDGDYVYIVYKKDSSGNNNDDRGYVLIPRKGIGGSSANVWKSITATPKTYTINFYDSGDGTVDVSSPIGTVTSNYQATFTAPSASGYVTLDQDVADMYGELLGWITEPWDGVSQDVISTLKCTGNMNLYAVYKNNYVGTRALVERNITGDLQCSATSVGEYAFSDLDGLEYIDLTNATSIGAHAFENDSNLVMVDIRTSACDIDPTAFDGCYSLEEIRVPVGSLTYYQTELGSLGVTITEHAWSDFEPNGWLGGTVEDISGLPTPNYS